MDVLASECSSGCESGWTLYFEHSMDASHREPRFLDESRGGPFDIAARYKRVAGEVEIEDEEEEEEEEEEEDLSMVSDASSGPLHYLHEDQEEEEDRDRCHEGCFSNSGGGFNKLERQFPETGKRSASLQCKSSSKRKKEMGDRHHPSLLDDTASSPLINSFPIPSNEFMQTNSAAPLDSVLMYSHGFSTPHFEGSSAAQHQLGILQPSLSSHQFQKNQRTGRKKMELR